MDPQQAQSHFEEYIEEIAAATVRHNGVAFKLTTCQFLPPMDVWEFPKYPAKTVILPPQADLAHELRKFFSVNEQFLREADCWLGTWVNPQTHYFYLDITTGCQSLEEARELALKASQREGRRVVAIYNSKQNKTVFL